MSTSPFLVRRSAEARLLKTYRIIHQPPERPLVARQMHEKQNGEIRMDVVGERLLGEAYVKHAEPGPSGYVVIRRNEIVNGPTNKWKALEYARYLQEVEVSEMPIHIREPNSSDIGNTHRPERPEETDPQNET